MTGDYRIGIDGSLRSRLELLVDGHEVASDRNVQNWPSNFEPLATVHLLKGAHRLDVPLRRPGRQSRQRRHRGTSGSGR